MQKAQQGNQVKIHYTVRLEDGQVVGTSKGGHPLTFTIGDGKVIKGLDEGVRDMQIGEKKQITLTPDQAYGQRNEELVLQVDKDQLPGNIDLRPGRPIQYQNHDGARVNLMILDVSGDTVTLDGNHPLAGQTVTYEVELVALP